ncbi:MAG: response regulator [Deltaproteobacteria bacterium]|nr:response regulator [Deltaproteobacteria bacterium]
MGHVHILVVDDDRECRELLWLALSRQGYHVSTAEHGLDGLVKIDRAGRKPDLLILDVCMPELDGISLLRALKSQPETSGIPAIILSGESDTSTVSQGFLAGAKYFLTKPTPMIDLLAAVRRALRSDVPEIRESRAQSTVTRRIRSQVPRSTSSLR